MNIVIISLLITAVLMTLVSLLGGLFLMAKGGELNKRYGNAFMRARVVSQGLTIVLFVIAFFLMGVRTL
tara:strand:- start:1169 stop:1375 length:207 start_codon:yes stop_codon:yes gene_type:complete